MAYSTVPKVKRDGKIVLSDGTGSPVTLEVAYEDGNFSADFPSLQSSLVVYDRGSLSAVRKQDDQFITASFSANMREFTDATAGSIVDFCNKTNAYSGNLSAATGTLPYIEQYCIDIVFTVEGTDHGDLKDHTATYSKCIPDSISFSEGDPSSFTISFTGYGGVVYT